MFTRRFVPVLTVLIVVTSLTAWSQAAEITPVKVIGGGPDQVLPSANAHWIGWSSNSTAAPDHYDAYVRPLVAGVPTGTIYKLNAGATSFGLSPDIQTDANTAVFQRTNATETRSDIYTADLGTLPPVAVAPTGINTSDWERDPVISQHWILFARDFGDTDGIFLYNRTTHVTISLMNLDIGHVSSRVEPGDVTETYATWTRGGASRSNIYYYNLSTQVTTLLANPTKARFYDPGISDATGDMYFFRSGHGCGVNAKIFRWHIGDPAVYTVVSSLPAGYNNFTKVSVFNDGTHDTLYFDRGKCLPILNLDIFKVPSADTAS